MGGQEFGLDPQAENLGREMVLDNYGPKVVGENQFFVLGEYRDNSTDSRLWGFLPRDKIIGKIQYIYWSDDWDRIGQRVE